MNTIITGDCIEQLTAIQPRTVNLVVADPPYNIGIDYGDGKKADRLPDAAYIEWTRAWVNEASRTLTPDGTMWVICGQEYAGDYQIAMRDAGLHWRNTVIWRETFGANCTRKFNRTARSMHYFTKHRTRFTFNVDELRTRSRRQELGDTRANPVGKVLDDVWTISRVCGTFRERVPGMPTQLPLALVRRIVRGVSRPGDLVVDPFTGSGTTGVVCVETGRRFHGIELRAEYAEKAKVRMNASMEAES